MEWALSGLPFLTEPGALLDAVSASIKAITGRETQASTSGGTSDGRFIATLGTQVVELGPVNATIHQVNERILATTSTCSLKSTTRPWISCSPDAGLPHLQRTAQRGGQWRGARRAPF